MSSYRESSLEGAPVLSPAHSRQPSSVFSPFFESGVAIAAASAAWVTSKEPQVEDKRKAVAAQDSRKTALGHKAGCASLSEFENLSLRLWTKLQCVTTWSFELSPTHNCQVWKRFESCVSYFHINRSWIEIVPSFEATHLRACRHTLY